MSVTLGKKESRKKKFHWQLWKINNTLLKDDDFVRGVSDILNKMISRKDTCLLEKWEYFKEEVKQIAIERSSYLQRQARREEKGLQKCL